MKKIFLFSLSFFLFMTVSAQDGPGREKFDGIIYDVAPFNPSAPVDTTPSANFPYPTLFNWHYSAIAGVNAGTVGAFWKNGKYYLNRWNSSMLYRYNGGLSGPDTFSDSATYQGSIRDLAADDDFIYGSPASTTIHKMNDNLISTGTITSGGGNVRAFAYSADENAFFVSDFSNNIGVINAVTGALIRTLTGTSTLAGKYGMAYSNIPGDVPALWVWGQGTNADPYNKLWKLDPQTGSTIETYQFGPLPPSGGTSPLGIAGGANVVIIDGWYVLLLNYQNYALAGYKLGEAGPPCPVDPPSNPSPANAATGVSINLAQITWTNPPTANSNELYFGTNAGNLTLVQSGNQSSYSVPGPLTYSTQYFWRVKEKNDTCSVNGPIWSFTTEQDPNIAIVFNEPFANLSCWTPTGPMGTTNWTANSSSNAGSTAPELRLNYSPSFNGVSNLLSCMINSSTMTNNVSFVHMVDNYNADPSPKLGLAVTYDGGTTSTELWSVIPPSGGVNVGPETVNFSFAPASADYQLIFFCDGNSFNINYWYVDDLYIDYIVPVELISFTATAYDKEVRLKWSTATETNNAGFEIQRKSNDEYVQVGYISGYGTTTEVKEYTFVDSKLEAGKYSYRLKQIDFDGSFEYSNEAEVEVIAPTVFALEQNYPNPFNPSTKINYSIAVDSRVTLKVFDILGQEVIVLVNKNMPAGAYEAVFDASKFNSGVYFYSIEAEGVNGNRFSSVKKMILAK